MAEDDKEYDNVFLTTSNNIGYKLGFAAGRETQRLNIPKEMYIPPFTQINSLEKGNYEDFK